MVYKLGLDINIDKVSWSVMDLKNNIKDCGTFIININSEDKDNYFKGEKISSISKRNEIRKNRRQNNKYKYRRDRLIKKLVSIDFCSTNILQKKFTKNHIYKLRQKAQRQEVTRDEFSLICIHFNKNRGYKHNRLLDKNKELKYIEENDLILEKEGLNVSEFLLKELEKGNHSSIEKYIFSRNKILEDFDIICRVQAKFKKNILTLKNLQEIRDRIIFYQKDFSFSSQKYNSCFFEKFHKNAHISNPFYQDFNLWKQLNKLVLYDNQGEEYILDIKTKSKLFNIISKKDKINSIQILKELEKIGDLDNYKDWVVNLDYIQGNYLRYEFIKILTNNKIPNEKIEELSTLDYKNNNLSSQPFFDIWHSIYSIYDEEGIQNKLKTKYNLSKKTAKEISNIRLNEKTQFSYLSTKACRKLIIEMQEGFMYSMACKKLGYKNYNKINYSNSLKKESPLHRLVLNRVEKLISQINSKYSLLEINAVIDPYLLVNRKMREK